MLRATISKVLREQGHGHFGGPPAERWVATLDAIGEGHLRLEYSSLEAALQLETLTMHTPAQVVQAQGPVSLSEP